MQSQMKFREAQAAQNRLFLGRGRYWGTVDNQPPLGRTLSPRVVRTSPSARTAGRCPSGTQTKGSALTVSPTQLGSTAARRDRKTPELGRIEQRTTPSAVADVLRVAILGGTLAPGSQLREAHIAADLGVSRAPLREGLSILADEGLVVKIPYRGAFVAEVSPRAISEIASLRKRLEPYAIELALPRLASGGRSKAVEALQKMQRSADDGDVSLIEAHMAFHRVFYELSGHDLLLNLWRSWESQLRLFFAVDHQSFENLHDVVDDHRNLLNIIDTGDLKAITRAVNRHVHDPGQLPDGTRQGSKSVVAE
jgi:DNA-binding GntR family transcriptional regulator